MLNERSGYGFGNRYGRLAGSGAGEGDGFQNGDGYGDGFTRGNGSICGNGNGYGVNFNNPASALIAECLLLVTDSFDALLINTLVRARSC